MITVIKQNLGVVDQAAVGQGESLNPLLEVRHHIPGKATLHHKPEHLKAIKHRLKDFWDLKPITPSLLRNMQVCYVKQFSMR